MRILETNKFDIKYTIKIIARKFIVYLFAGLFFLYFTTINSNSEGYINDVPSYFNFILVFLIILYSVKLFYDAKAIHNSFSINIDADKLIVEQKIEPKHTIVDMKEVEKLVHSKKGLILFYKNGDTGLENFFAIVIRIIKNEEELIQYLSRYQVVELEDDENKVTTRGVIGLIIIVMIFGFFFITKSIYFIIPFVLFIMWLGYMTFRYDRKNIGPIAVLLFLFSLVKLGFAVNNVFM